MSTSASTKPKRPRAYVPVTALAKSVEFDEAMMQVVDELAQRTGGCGDRIIRFDADDMDRIVQQHGVSRRAADVDADDHRERSPAGRRSKRKTATTALRCGS